MTSSEAGSPGTEGPDGRSPGTEGPDGGSPGTEGPESGSLGLRVALIGSHPLSCPGILEALDSFEERVWPQQILSYMPEASF